MQLIEIFKAGKRRDANGNEVEITTADLQALVEAYDPQFHEAPAVVGHPKDNHPAYAWVKGVQLDGDILKAELDQIDPAFAEMVQTGRFKKISASFYLPNSPANPKQGAFYLRHVGFLGAMPPAVKGLRNPEFAEGEEGVLDFSEWQQASVLRQLRDWLIGKFGKEEADQAMPDYLVTGIHESAVREEERRYRDRVGEAPFNEPSPNPEPSQPSEDTMTEAEIAAIKAENEQLKAQQAAAEKAKAEAQAAADKASNAAFAEHLISEGKLAPIAKEKALELLEYCASVTRGEAVDFNEGESLHSLLKAFLEAQPKVVEFSEVAAKDKVATPEADTVQYAETDDPTRIELDRRVRAYMQQHSVDYATALAAVA